MQGSPGPFLVPAHGSTGAPGLVPNLPQAADEV